MVSHCCVLENLRNANTGRKVINFSKRILMHGVSGLNWNRTIKWIKASAVSIALDLLVS
jgi:hypothetical protein